jgi:ADP-heptose:LPS heptosyltransferase
MFDPLKTIVIYHPAAIGDVVLATAVPVVLKHNFPNIKIIHLTHKSLLDLLHLCPAIDQVIAFDKNASLWQQREQIAKLNADLFIDLTGSLRAIILSLFNAKKNIAI